LTGSDLKGTTVWAGARALKCKGVCENKLWPDYIENVSNHQLALAVQDAKKRRSAFYQRCFDIADIKSNLLQNGSIMLSFNVYTSFYDSYDDGIVPMPSSTDSWVGSHCVAVIGYDDNKKLLTFINSWGEDYGDSGFGYLPYDYMNDYVIEALADASTERFAVDSTSGINKCIEHHEENLRLFCGISKGYTFIHNNIMIYDLYDSNNDLLGWIINSKVNSTTVELIDFFVWPENRKKGYGQLLINQMIEYEQTVGVKKIVGWMSIDDTRISGVQAATQFFRNRNWDYVQKAYDFMWSPGQLILEL
jgi:GNAT superfamily N-acetyltransferase